MGTLHFDDGFCTAVCAGPILPADVQIECAMPPVNVLSRSLLTKLMRGERIDVKTVSRKRRKCISWYRNLSFEDQQKALHRHGIYIATSKDPQEKDAADEQNTESEAKDTEPEMAGSEDSSESDGAPGLGPVSESKRRRVLPRPGPLPHLHKSVGTAVIPTRLDSCRLSRELSTEIYSVNWGRLKNKPDLLRIWGDEHRPGLPTELQAIGGRESGVTYYCTAKLHESASAHWLLKHVKSKGDGYSRMQLLLTPTSHFFPVGADIMVKQKAVDFNAMDVDAEDGQSEISLELARHWKVVKVQDVLESMADGAPGLLYAPMQFRGMVSLTDTHELVEVKGTIIINETLQGKMMVLHKSCCKVDGDENFEGQRGIEISKTTKTGWKDAKICPQFIAAMRQRISCVSTPQKRGKLTRTFRTWLAKAKHYTVDSLIDESFGLAEHEKPSQLPRKSVADIRMKYEEANQCPTPMADLNKAFEDPQAHSISNGTKESMKRGVNRFSMQYRSLRKKPSLRLKAQSATLYAVSDPCGELPAKCCYVIKQGQPITGKVVVWRAPTQLPWDLELWEALPFPQGRVMPTNCCVVSRKGLALSRMAGGDFDGDLVMVVFDEVLVNLVHETTAAIADIDVEALTAWVGRHLNKGGASFETTSRKCRANEFVEYALHDVNTSPLRGTVCALAERAQHKALESRSAEFQKHAYLWGIASHRTMDVPKHYAEEDILALVQILEHLTGVCTSLPRSTIVIEDEIRLDLQLDYKKPLQCLKDLLKPKLEQITLGKVLFPQSQICLGAEAGLQVRKHILQIVFNELHVWERPAAKTVLQELAGLIAVRSRQAGKLRKILADGDPVCLRKTLAKSRAKPIDSVLSLDRVPLL